MLGPGVSSWRIIQSGTKWSNILCAVGILGHTSSNVTSRRRKSLNASPVCANTLLWRAQVHVEEVPKTWVVEPPNNHNNDSSGSNQWLGTKITKRPKYLLSGAHLLPCAHVWWVKRKWLMQVAEIYGISSTNGDCPGLFAAWLTNWLWRIGENFLLWGYQFWSIASSSNSGTWAHHRTHDGYARTGSSWKLQQSLGSQMCNLHIAINLIGSMCTRWRVSPMFYMKIIIPYRK